ncbi:hypothetical protein [Streptomyces sp. NPDC014623]|uniref:hypothetical protein n=1 Tax=Streptomyces sp. NPDC014623 TaxID=3364875 RepID=UPI0036F60FC5
MSLGLVALLATAGCVSVQGEAGRPAPAASARSGNDPAAHASPAPTEPPAVHDVLGRTGELPGSAGGKEGKEGEGDASTRRADAPPARQEARNQPRRVAPARPGLPDRAGTPRRAQPRRTYDMRTICATGQGVASADIVELCRTAYGR